MFKHLKGFVAFVREHGVVGMAIGFMIGAGVQKVVSALVNDLINPLISLLLPNAGDLRTASFEFRGVQFLWGDFAATALDFVIIAAVVYFLFFRVLRLDRIDPEKK